MPKPTDSEACLTEFNEAYETAITDCVLSTLDSVMTTIRYFGYINFGSEVEWQDLKDEVNSKLRIILQHINGQALNEWYATNPTTIPNKDLLEFALQLDKRLRTDLKPMQDAWLGTPVAKNIRNKFEGAQPSVHGIEVRLITNNEEMLRNLRVRIMTLIVLFTYIDLYASIIPKQDNTATIDILFNFLKQLQLEETPGLLEGQFVILRPDHSLPISEQGRTGRLAALLNRLRSAYSASGLHI